MRLLCTLILGALASQAALAQADSPKIESSSASSPDSSGLFHFTVELYDRTTLNTDNTTCYNMIFKNANYHSRYLNTNTWTCRAVNDKDFKCGGYQGIRDPENKRLVMWWKFEWQNEMFKTPVIDERITMFHTYVLPTDGKEGSLSIKGVQKADWPSDETLRSTGNTDKIPSLCEIRFKLRTKFEPSPFVSLNEEVPVKPIDN